jgi:hypothetical protein
VGGGAVHTVIDLASPANATGSITAVKYHWSAAGCANAEDQVLSPRRPDVHLTAERDLHLESVETITLAPPVEVQQGDLIGITRLTSCGTPLASDVPSDGFSISPPTSRAQSLSPERSVRCAFACSVRNRHRDRGGGGRPRRRRVDARRIRPELEDGPADLQPELGRDAHRKLVFRPEANTTSPFPSLAYSLGPGQMKAYEDVVAAMGQSGLGSLDLVVPAGQGQPIVVSRIYNDLDAAGTAGLSQDLIPSEVRLKGVSRILRRGTTGFLFTPPNLAKTRLNIGLRTLDSGAYFEVKIRNDAGATVRTLTKSYSPNWFIQVSSSAFLGSIAERDDRDHGQPRQRDHLRVHDGQRHERSVRAVRVRVLQHVSRGPALCPHCFQLCASFESVAYIRLARERR